MFQEHSFLFQLLVNLGKGLSYIRLNSMNHKRPRKIRKKTTSNPGGMRSELVKIYIENPDLQEAWISGVLVLIPIFFNAFGQVTLELV